MKLPLFFGEPNKDAFPIENWVARVDNLQHSFGWTDSVTASHSYNSLRDKALSCADFLRMNNFNINDWRILRKYLLEQFGSFHADNQNVVNLAMTQKANEPANVFGHRVGVTVGRYFECIPEMNHTMNEKVRKYIDISCQGERPVTTAENRAKMLEPALALSLDWIVNAAAEELRKAERQHLMETIQTNVFLNGLDKDIRSATKLQGVTTIYGAILAATKVENSIKNMTKQLNHMDVKHEMPNADDSDEANVNFTSRPFNRSRRPPTSSHSGYRKPLNVECWYCHKKNHTQRTCRLRISRGAAMVSKPRTVLEINEDYLGYQDGEPDEVEEEDNSQPGEATATTTEPAQTNSVHLN